MILQNLMQRKFDPKLCSNMTGTVHNDKRNRDNRGFTLNGDSRTLNSCEDEGNAVNL